MVLCLTCLALSLRPRFQFLTCAVGMQVNCGNLDVTLAWCHGVMAGLLPASTMTDSVGQVTEMSLDARATIVYLPNLP